MDENATGEKEPVLWEGGAAWSQFIWLYLIVGIMMHQVDFKWIKGHNNQPQNERCDALAVMASHLPNLSLDAFYEQESQTIL